MNEAMSPELQKLWQHLAAISGGGASAPPQRSLMGAMNTGMGGGLMGSSSGGPSTASPWDALFTVLGQGHGALAGDDPNTLGAPGGRDKTDKEWMVNAGGPIGGAIGGVFGFAGAGQMAGHNVGATIADATSGNIKNLGLDVSRNLPPLPGMQREGWQGLLNSATGLPIASLFDLFK